MASGQEFAYAIATDTTTPPADADMTAFLLQPNTYPIFLPYGTPYRAADGSILYTSKPQISILFPGNVFDTDTDGTAVLTGTVKALYADWRTARDQHRQQFWITYYNPIDRSWHKALCVMWWPDWSNKLEGVAWVGLIVIFVALGQDTTSYSGGEPDPPDYNYDSDTLGDGFAGSFGHGRYGRGYYGRGEL